MSSRKIAAVLGALVVLVVFGSTVTTGALWNSAAPLGAGQVQSGQLVLLNGDDATQVKSYAFDELAGTALAPGSYAQAPLVITNGGNIPLGYELFSAIASKPALADSLNLRVSRVAASGDCPTGENAGAPTGATIVYDGPLDTADSGAQHTIAVGAGDTLCLRVGLLSSAPASVQDTSTTITFTFQATSR